MRSSSSKELRRRCAEIAATAQQPLPLSSTVSLARLADDRPSAATAGVQHMWHLLQSKCAQLRRMRTSDDMRRLTKAARKWLGLSRSPKGKGYETFLSDEEKRLMFVCRSISHVMLTLAFLPNRWMDEYSSRYSTLSAGPGVPYYY